ncbi:MAG: BPSS1780 family membrane protein [Aquabacterium sp.]
MGLRLHAVAPARGWAWVLQGLRLFTRRPGAFTGLFLFFLIGMLLAMTLPWIGGLAGAALWPMLTLGFMIASRSALAGGPVLPTQLIEGLRGPDRRRAVTQAVLCLTHALVVVAVFEAAHAFDDGAWVKLQNGLARGDTGAKMEALWADPLLAPGMLLRMGLGTLASVPFWFAPALVFWGGQSLGQALFSSVLALWRAKGAFVVFSVAWAALACLFGAGLAMLALLFSSRQLGVALALPMALALSVVFYVSLWFGYADAFGDDADPPVTA